MNIVCRIVVEQPVTFRSHILIRMESIKCIIWKKQKNQQNAYRTAMSLASWGLPEKVSEGISQRSPQMA